MKKLMSNAVALTALASLLAFAVPAGAAPPTTAPGQNKLLCFSDLPATCTLPTKGAKGTAILDTTLGGDAGVYVLNSNLNLTADSHVLLSDISILSFNYVGTPTAGSPRISLPVDLNGDGLTDLSIAIPAITCNNGAGLVDVINDPTCTIWDVTNGTTPLASNWAALLVLYPNATVAFEDYVFIISDDPGLWTISNVKLGKPGK